MISVEGQLFQITLGYFRKIEIIQAWTRGLGSVPEEAEVRSLTCLVFA